MNMQGFDEQPGTWYSIEIIKFIRTCKGLNSYSIELLQSRRTRQLVQADGLTYESEWA